MRALAALLCGALLATPAAAEKWSEQRLREATAPDAARDAAIVAQFDGADYDKVALAMVEAVHDRTAIFYQPGHGVFVEYTAADGGVFMWYPGNTGVVTGTWALRALDGEPHICFHYGKSINPVTGVFEPTECIGAGQMLLRHHMLSSRAGDPFALASGKIPYRKHERDVPAWPAGLAQ